MTIENTGINPTVINAVVGEDITQKLNTKTLRNIKVVQEYNEKEAEDSALVSKKPKNNINTQTAEHQIMKEKQMIIKLESEVGKNLNTEDFMSDQQYQIIFNNILKNDLSLFNDLSKNKKVEFLIKTYQDISSHSLKVLTNILPYVDTISIRTSFKFYGPENISTAKKIALLNRLAPDAKPQADEAIIALLLTSDGNVVAGCSLNTLMSLRNKEYLGTKFYEQLSQQSNGKLTKAQHKQLAILSAKITTICYAYYIETTFEAVTASLKNNTALTEKDLALKGIKDEAKAKLLAQLKAENLLDKDNKVMGSLDPEKLKESIKNIVGNTLKMKEELAQKQKIAQIQQNIEDIIGQTMKLKADFEKSKAN